MAFGFMNTRRYALTYLTLGALFMNCVSVNWTMWSVFTISMFMLTLTDFMFFEVCLPRRARAAWALCIRDVGFQRVADASLLRARFGRTTSSGRRQARRALYE